MTDYGPGVRFPPPVGILIIVGLAELINRLFITVELLPVNYWASGALYLIATTITLLAIIQFRRHKTNVTPFSPDTALLDKGIFRFSRNPIYVSFLIYQIMFGFVFGNIWQVFLLPVSYVFLRLYVIAKEERYLTALFGKPYIAYQQNVRRWI